MHEHASIAVCVCDMSVVATAIWNQVCPLFVKGACNCVLGAREHHALVCVDSGVLECCLDCAPCTWVPAILTPGLEEGVALHCDHCSSNRRLLHFSRRSSTSVVCFEWLGSRCGTFVVFPHAELLSCSSCFKGKGALSSKFQKHFHPKTLSSKTISSKFRPMTLSSKNGFVQ